MKKIIIFLLYIMHGSYLLLWLGHSLKKYCLFLVTLNHYSQKTTAHWMQPPALGMSTDLFGCLKLFTEIYTCMWFEAMVKGDQSFEFSVVFGKE